MAHRSAVFIDAGYLDHLLRSNFARATINYAKFGERLTVGTTHLRTYYYTCPAFQSDPPTMEESERYANQRRFFDALESLPRFTTKLGRLALQGPDSTGRFTHVQKGVDILLGVDMAMLSAKHQIQEAILIAGDGDFVPAVIAAKAEGVLIKLYHGPSPSSDLWREADERVLISQELIDSVRRTGP